MNRMRNKDRRRNNNKRRDNNHNDLEGVGFDMPRRADFTTDLRESKTRSRICFLIEFSFDQT